MLNRKNNTISRVQATTVAWTPNKKRFYDEWRTFSDIIYEMEHGFKAISDPYFHSTGMRVEARRMSVIARKLLLDGSMLKRLIYRPTFHRLNLIPRNWASITIAIGNKGDVLSRTEIGKVELNNLPGYTLALSSGKIEKVGLPKLPGGAGTLAGSDGWNLYSEIFDRRTEPNLRLDRWMKQPLLEGMIGDKFIRCSIEQVVKYVANTEGAHSETLVCNPRTARSYRHEKATKLGQWLEMLGGLNEMVEDSITYPHWVVMCAVAYIYNQIQIGFRYKEIAWKKEMGKCYPGDRGYVDISGRIPLLIQGPFASLESDKLGKRLKMQAAKQLYNNS